MGYLTFTAPSSEEVRKAILRHRTDVLQIAAIYFATKSATEFSRYRAKLFIN